jgi:phosphonoacetate hydrolase
MLVIQRFARSASTGRWGNGAPLSMARCFATAAASSGQSSVTVNGVSYRLPQPRPLVAVLIDGGSQDYLAAASAAGATPFLDGLLRPAPGANNLFRSAGSARGTHALVSGQVPTLTNPNNVAIVCGAPASVTGISGNYFLDESVDPPKETLMNSAAFLRAPTVFAQMQQQAGMHVTILTAKDKLLALLGAGLEHSNDSARTLAFSIEKLGAAAAAEAQGAATATNVSTPAGALTPQQRMQLHRGVSLRELTAPFYEYFESRPELLATCSPAQRKCIADRAVPDIYNPHISLYLLELGLQLLRADLAREQSASCSAQNNKKDSLPPSRLYYLSTTDFVQHKYMPSDHEAVEFYRYIDSVLGRLDALGAVVGVTADHGMGSKVGFDGRPKVVFLAEELAKHGVKNPRIVLPITDPYVRHHSSLGGYATVYLEDKRDEEVQRAMKLLRATPGIYTVLNRAEAAKAFELPSDRLGDIVVLADGHSVLGKGKEDHDLDQVPHLRTHGGLDEATVPMLINRRLDQQYSKRMTTGKARNWHLLDIMLNGVEHDE